MSQKLQKQLNVYCISTRKKNKNKLQVTKAKEYETGEIDKNLQITISKKVQNSRKQFELTEVQRDII